MQREDRGTDDHGGATRQGLSTEDLAGPREGAEAGRGSESPASGNEAASAGPAAGTPQPSAPEQAKENEPLLGPEEAEEFHTRWKAIQTAFVDDPQDAVRSADALVAEVMQSLAGSFASRKEGLESQWGRGEEVLTEDLRIALQRYRSFFNRLLST
ncbi:hypothetical protein [Streptomyces sp. NPDC048473]|uniref:hypothetical protein n=1 Tax=unclassified Streptomyces TaxID=2593676 RepID=UPI003722DA47